MQTMRTMRTTPSFLALALLLALGLAPVGCSSDEPTRPSLRTSAGTSAAFHDAMRKLWEDHITWTRLFIVSAGHDLPDLGPTTDRLLRNQADIGNAVKPFYGDAAGDGLTALLRGHISTAAELVAAAKAGDQVRVAEASSRWYANADSIASFLSTANPAHWPLADMKVMMREHLDLTLAEAVAHLQGDYAADIAAYDRIHDQILGMADMLSAGIIAQFPGQLP